MQQLFRKLPEAAFENCWSILSRLLSTSHLSSRPRKAALLCAEAELGTSHGFSKYCLDLSSLELSSA